MTPGESSARQALQRSMELNGDRMAPERQAEVAEIDPQEFGRLQAQVETLIETHRVSTETLTTLSTAIQAMQLQMAEAKGGWKVLMLIGGASASLGSVATWAMAHLFGRGHP